MLVGLVWLLATTLLLCFSQNIAMLLIARILQGMSAAMTWSVGLALLIDSVDKKHIGRATGWTSTALTLGILLGPLVGGIVYDRAGNYPVFAICFGLIAFDIVLRLVIIEVKDAKRWLAKDDTPSTLTTAEPVCTEEANVEITPLEHDMITEEARPAPAQLGKEPTSALEKGAAAMAAREARSGAAFSITGRSGIFGLLRNPRILCALWGTVIQSAVQTSFDAILPLEVRDTFHWNSIGGGLIFLPVIIPTFLGPFIGGLSDTHGPRWFTAAGFLFCVPFLVCFRFVTENTLSHKIMLCGLLLAVGVGQALQIAPLMAEISWAAEEGRYGSDDDAGGIVGARTAGQDEDGGGEEEEEAEVPYAQAYALYNIAFSAGAIVGPLLAGMVRESRGFGTVGWSLAILCGFTAVVMANWTGGAPLYSFGRRKGRAGASPGQTVDANDEGVESSVPAGETSAAKQAGGKEAMTV